MTQKALILDLDNTIFETRSMDKNAFTPFFNALRSNLDPDFDKITIDKILDELWDKTWDVIMREHGISADLFIKAIDVLEQTTPDLKISVYPDYSYIKDLRDPKYLVTTSITSLQRVKIKALGIETDFDRIVINDTFKENKTKQDVFEELIREFGLIPGNTYVIGDNADSEIRAGNNLNMITVQILRNGVTRGNNARHYINSFTELENIFKNH
jgi:putative hydrolase of the HAD superfamily